MRAVTAPAWSSLGGRELYNLYATAKKAISWVLIHFTSRVGRTWRREPLKNRKSQTGSCRNSLIEGSLTLHFLLIDEFINISFFFHRGIQNSIQGSQWSPIQAPIRPNLLNFSKVPVLCAVRWCLVTLCLTHPLSLGSNFFHSSMW